MFGLIYDWIFPLVPPSIRNLPLVMSVLLTVSWWLMMYCPLMVDCTPAWLSAPLEMHQEMLQYTVRVYVCLCVVEVKEDLVLTYSVFIHLTYILQFSNICFSFFQSLFPRPPPTHSPARSASLLFSLTWTHLSPLLHQNTTHQWRNTNHKFCPAVEAKCNRTVEGDQRLGFRWNICFSKRFSSCVSWLSGENQE